jgi:hypothetical protein
MTAVEDHTGGEFSKTSDGYGGAAPSFPEHFLQNEESSGFQTVCRKTCEILLPMTRHKATQTGLGNPSPLDHWINALLRVFAMLVSHAAHLCSMRLIRLSAECHSDATPEALPCKESGKLKETTQAAECSHTRRTSASSSLAHAKANESHVGREALMVSSVAIATRPSNHEGGLTVLSASHPRARPEDLGSRSGGTLSNSHDPTTEIPGMRFAYPRMTRCGFSWGTT